MWRNLKLLHMWRNLINLHIFMWRKLKLLHMWRYFRFFHNRHAWKVEISPHGKFFLHQPGWWGWWQISGLCTQDPRTENFKILRPLLDTVVAFTLCMYENEIHVQYTYEKENIILFFLCEASGAVHWECTVQAKLEEAASSNGAFESNSLPAEPDDGHVERQHSSH